MLTDYLRYPQFNCDNINPGAVGKANTSLHVTVLEVAVIGRAPACSFDCRLPPERFGISTPCANKDLLSDFDPAIPVYFVAHHVDWLQVVVFDMPVRLDSQSKLVLHVLHKPPNGHHQVPSILAHQQNVVHVKQSVSYKAYAFATPLFAQPHDIPISVGKQVVA